MLEETPLANSPKRKVTYSLPEELVDSITEVVRDGAAPSYSAFVEEALRKGVRTARERALAQAFRVAADDTAFLDDVEESMQVFRHADRETEKDDR
jgi:Arc/MetJ-type ribon-helix-helix transcriptional regulator